jgi:putrescine transport system substrate-binding protein
MSTRSLSALVSASCVFLLIACGKKEEAPPAGDKAAGPAKAVYDTDAEKVVNVYNWSDYIDHAVLEQFEADTGIKVNYEVMDSNALLETKLRAGRSGYDVVVPSASYLARQITSNIYQPLDRSKLDGLKNLDPEITKKLEVFDPGNQYAVNYMWGTSGVAYNEGKILAAMKDAPVDSFAMFWDPKVVSKFAKCGVSVLDEPGEVLGTVLMYLGKDPNSESPEDLKAAEKVLLSVRPYIRLVNSSKYIEDLASGEICLALGWSGDTLQARDRADENKTGEVIKYNIPKEGAVMFFDNMAVPADAAHVKNAHIFINYMLRPEIAAQNSNAISFANSNAASWPLINADVKGNPGIFPTAEMMSKLVADLPESPEFTKELTRTWTRFKTGK